MERRPFKVLRPPERSRAIVIARYTNRQPATCGLSPAEPADLLWKAVRMGGLCAACAFAFFFLSQRNLFERSSPISIQLPDTIERLRFEVPAALADAESFAAPAKPLMFALPQAPNLAVTEFNLPVTPEFQAVGDIRLKVNAVNPSANTYDITVQTSRREFYRQDVKLDERLPLAKDSTSGPELVVGAIAQNRVFGYLSEPQRRGHRRHRHRK
jgi:hypothetical protein